MFGDKTNSERHELKETVEHSINRFEKGATNRFKLKGVDVGKVILENKEYELHRRVNLDQNYSY